MTRREIERMTQALKDGVLGETEFDQLQRELRANPASRAFFRQSLEMEMLLSELIGRRALIGGAHGNIDEILHRRQRRDLKRALLAAAAVLLLAGIILALVVIRQTAPPQLSSTSVPGTSWQVDGQDQASDSNVRKVTEGSTVGVASGAVKLEFDSGMVMLLRGPAEVSFPKLERPVLKRGWLWIDSGKSTDSIEVDTPRLRVRDIGTRFGVRVRDDGLAEVHLVEGKLEIASKGRKEEPLTLEPTQKGIFLPASGAPTELPLAPDPFPALPELLASSANYMTTLLSQSPVGYWRLDERAGEKLENEIAEGVVGEQGGGVTLGEAGMAGADGFHGFSPENRSVFMGGHHYGSVLVSLDQPGGVKRDEGAVSFWIRRPPGSGLGEILWLAGDGADDTTRNPAKALMHTRLSATGRVEFFIENGEFDVLLSSNFSVADDRWHHVAASWGTSAVELYVDGDRVARADDYGKLQKGILHGRHVRFGKPSDNLQDEGMTKFTGWVDEIALWNRPLTGFEIAHQLRAARGTVKKAKEAAPAGGRGD